MVNINNYSGYSYNYYHQELQFLTPTVGTVNQKVTMLIINGSKHPHLQWFITNSYKHKNCNS